MTRALRPLGILAAIAAILTLGWPVCCVGVCALGAFVLASTIEVRS